MGGGNVTTFALFPLALREVKASLSFLVSVGVSPTFFFLFLVFGLCLNRDDFVLFRIDFRGILPTFFSSFSVAS